MIHQIIQKGIIGLALLLAATLASHAQNYSIDWHKVAGGGGSSSNSQYLVTGTIGQHDASGPMTGGAFSLTGGFWSLFVIQTLGAPLLKIFLTATNTAVITWPSPSLGWNLQQNADLSTTNWVAPSENGNDNGTNRFVVVNPAAGKHFFRLAKP